jgi:protein-tyrosine kinase
MEHIRQAVELARGAQSAGAHPELPRSPLNSRPMGTASAPLAAGEFKIKEANLNLAHLEANRIIAHDRSDLRSRSFDMLRTQILQSMDTKSWQLLAVASPTPACGKSVTAINLALSIARQPERSVLLVDMDLEKPQIAKCLGIECKDGLVGVLNGRGAYQNALVQANIGMYRLTVLPCEASTAHSSEYMSSRAMSIFLQELKNEDRSRIIIFDLPPILSGDNVLSILPQIDCVLFVTAVGITTASDIKECNRHLQTTPVVRVVLNKTSDLGPVYY